MNITCVVTLVLQSMSVMEVMRGGLMRPLSLGVIVMVLQQATGVNAILFYAQNIFEKAKVTVMNFALLTLAFVITFAVHLIPAYYLRHRR